MVHITVLQKNFFLTILLWENCMSCQKLISYLIYFLEFLHKCGKKSWYTIKFFFSFNCENLFLKKANFSCQHFSKKNKSWPLRLKKTRFTWVIHHETIKEIIILWQIFFHKKLLFFNCSKYVVLVPTYIWHFKLAIRLVKETFKKLR